MSLILHFGKAMFITSVCGAMMVMTLLCLLKFMLFFATLIGMAP